MAARPLVARQPNERLQALIQEAGCSNAGLARRVNMCGAEHGLDLRYDKTSVARWLRGQQPRGGRRRIIAEALGRKLGRTVTIDEIGMANGKNLASGVGLQFSPTVLGAIEQVCELWRSDVGRRDFLSGSTVAASALVEPSRDWLITDARRRRSRAAAGPRVGASDVAAVRAMTAGSGRPRPPVRQRACAAGRRPLPQQRGLRAAGRLVPRGGGPGTLRRGRPADGTRRIHGSRHRPARSRPALLHPGAAARPGSGRPWLRRVRPGRLHEPPRRRSSGNPREIAQLARAAQEGDTGAGDAARRGDVLRGGGARARAAGRRPGRPGGGGPGAGRDGPRGVGHPARATTRRGSRTSTARIWPTSWPTATATWARREAAARRARGALAGPPREPEPAAGPSALVLLATAQVQQREIEQACHTGTQGAGAAGDGAVEPRERVPGRSVAAVGAVSGGDAGAGVGGPDGSPDGVGWGTAGVVVPSVGRADG